MTECKVVYHTPVVAYGQQSTKVPTIPIGRTTARAVILNLEKMRMDLADDAAWKRMGIQGYTAPVAVIDEERWWRILSTAKQHGYRSIRALEDAGQTAALAVIDAAIKGLEEFEAEQLAHLGVKTEGENANLQAK